MADRSSAPPGGGAFSVQAAGTGVPPAVLRSWDEAEARIFPLVMARPDLYQQSVSTIQRLLGRLRENCPDLPTLLAAHEHGAELAAEDVADDGVAGIHPDLVVAAACAMRYRELAASLAAANRLTALARARDAGVAWSVVEEIGSPDRARYIPYQRIEAEVATGRAVIVSIGPDETLSRAVHHLDEGEIDLVTGSLRIGRQVGSYLDPDAFAAALQQAREAQSAPRGCLKEGGRSIKDGERLYRIKQAAAWKARDQGGEQWQSPWPTGPRISLEGPGRAGRPCHPGPVPTQSWRA